MKTESALHKLLIYLCFSFTLLLLSGCGATEQTEELAECRSDAPETCDSEDPKAEDRGYNPCLINKNLPVCKL
jgi:hypothetical protein